VGHSEEPRVQKCMEELEKQTATLKVLGSYPRGMEPSESLQGKDRKENGNGNGKDEAK